MNFEYQFLQLRYLHVFASADASLGQLGEATHYIETAISLANQLISQNARDHRASRLLSLIEQTHAVIRLQQGNFSRAASIAEQALLRSHCDDQSIDEARRSIGQLETCAQLNLLAAFAGEAGSGEPDHPHLARVLDLLSKLPEGSPRVAAKALLAQARYLDGERNTSITAIKQLTERGYQPLSLSFFFSHFSTSEH